MRHFCIKCFAHHAVLQKTFIFWLNNLNFLFFCMYRKKIPVAYQVYHKNIFFDTFWPSKVRLKVVSYICVGRWFELIMPYWIKYSPLSDVWEQNLKVGWRISRGYHPEWRHFEVKNENKFFISMLITTNKWKWVWNHFKSKTIKWNKGLF